MKYIKLFEEHSLDIDFVNSNINELKKLMAQLGIKTLKREKIGNRI